MNDLMPVDPATGVMPTYALILDQAPSQAIAQARSAAQALMDIISQKKKPVMFNGEQYLEFEDWQMVGHFYGLNAKVTRSEYVEMDGAVGFNSTAVIYHRATGKEISAADAICMNDEHNWQKKPLSQLKSMSQTRACAKAFRNVLSWVVVLAGFKPTPAEEMGEHTLTQPAFSGVPADPASTLVAQITTWLAAMNGGDVDRMNAHLKDITRYTPKGTTEEKFLQIKDLERVGKSKPTWIERIHKTVGKAFIDSKSIPAAEPQEPDESPIS